MTSLPKVALVTGAAKRIGKSIALGLARQGWDIVVHYGSSAGEARDTVREIEALGRRAAAIECDLSNEHAVRNLLPEANALLGPVSCIVNNASIFRYDQTATFTTAELDAHMHVNLAAPVILAQALFETTPQNSQSVVIHLLDQKLFNPNPDFLSYTLSKAALHSTITLLAQSLAPRVRVVGVAPGITLVSGDQTPASFERAHTMTPLGRSSTPEDISAAVCYAAQAGAVTGSTLIVDGGQHLIPSSRDVMFIAR